MTSEQIRTATSMLFTEYSLAPFAHLDKVEMLYTEPSVAFDELSLSWNWAHVINQLSSSLSDTPSIMMVLLAVDAHERTGVVHLRHASFHGVLNPSFFYKLF